MSWFHGSCCYVLPINPHRHEIHQSYAWVCKCRFLTAGVLWPLSKVSPEHGHASHQPSQRGAHSVAVSPARLAFLLLHPLKSMLSTAWHMRYWWGCPHAFVPQWLGSSSLSLGHQKEPSKGSTNFSCKRSEDDQNGRTPIHCVHIWDAKKQLYSRKNPFFILLVLFIIGICL